jgi:hypothetical protein
VAAVFVIATALPAAAANSPSLRVAFIRGGDLWVLDLHTRESQLLMTHAGIGPVHWSGDGRLVSSGGRIAGGPTLPTTELLWARTGELAAGVTHDGGVIVWTPQETTRLEPDGWGSTSVAWSDTGRLAIGRTIYGPPHNQEIWIWNGGSSPPVLAMKTGVQEPYPVTWQGNDVVWWDWPNSASIASDGVRLYIGRATVGRMLMYRDYVARCGSKLALAAGGDRYATHGKRIVLAGRDLSRDPSRSWVSPACNPSGALLVGAAGRNWEEDRFGHEHRSLWQLLPVRRRLTHPPAAWTDESPKVLADNSILFVRMKQSSRRVNGKWYLTEHAGLERLSGGVVRTVANVGFTAGASQRLGFCNYYGHYLWPSLIAPAP